jgi:large subunit ribosomal protein L11
MAPATPAAGKKVAATLKLQLEAGQANPGKVGQALGAHGVNIVEFCQRYNAATEARRGSVVPVEVTIHADRTFTFVTRTPPTSKLLLAAAGTARGSARPNLDQAGAVSREQLREIARTKLADLNTDDLDAAERIVAGTARSMGITVKD